MSKRRKRSGYTTHKRVWHGRAKAPKGRPWDKVADLLEHLKARHGFKAMQLPVFQTLWKLQTDNGWKGNAVTQFVWEHYNGNTEYMRWARMGGLDMQDLLAAVDGHAFTNWLDSYYAKHGSTHKRYGESRAEKAAATVGRIPPKQTGPSDSERMKQRGDEFRAQMSDANRIAEIMHETSERDRDIEDIWRLISKGEFPLGEAVFQAELERRATERKRERELAALFNRR